MLKSIIQIKESIIIARIVIKEEVLIYLLLYSLLRSFRSLFFFITLL